MPCVISWWSPDLISTVFMTTKSDLGQCPFTLNDVFIFTTHEGKQFFDCVWARLLLIGPKNHMQKSSYLTCSPCCPWEGGNLKGMDEVVAHEAKRLHTKEDNIIPIVNGWIFWPVYVVVWYICDNLPYVRFYAFRIILLVLTDYSI